MIGFGLKSFNFIIERILFVKKILKATFCPISNFKQASKQTIVGCFLKQSKNHFLSKASLRKQVMITKN
jgi:hypothetical protein